MDKTCEMKYKVVDSPLGKLEISGCEQGLHGIKLHGGKTPDTEWVNVLCDAHGLCLEQQRAYGYCLFATDHRVTGAPRYKSQRVASR